MPSRRSPKSISKNEIDNAAPTMNGTGKVPSHSPTKASEKETDGSSPPLNGVAEVPGDSTTNASDVVVAKPSAALVSVDAMKRHPTTPISEKTIVKSSNTFENMVLAQRRSSTDVSETEIIKPSPTLNGIVAVKSDSLRVTGQGFLRADEHEIGFIEDQHHAVQTWNNIADACSQRLSDADKRVVNHVYDKASLDSYISKQLSTHKSSEFSTQMLTIKPLSQTLDIFVGAFERNVRPVLVSVKLLWGMVYYAIKLSTESSEKLRRVAGWLQGLRRSLVLCNACMDACGDQQNELRLVLPEMLKSLMDMIYYIVNKFLNSSSGDEIVRASHQIDAKVKECFDSFGSTRNHLSEMNSYTKVNQEGQALFRAIRTVPILTEKAPLPITLSKERNEQFFGRQVELAKINAKLGVEEIDRVLSFTIYGRRGVGKTQMALEYAHRNIGNFDAVFWIRCETSAALRQSVADAARDLNLLGSKQSGHHEENLAGVHEWLKTTRCRWLLVFDNAESENLLKGYWPLGAKGSILITSRNYYNFLKDSDRGGMTVPTFTVEQSLELLFKLLGEDWEAQFMVEPFRLSDLEAGKALMGLIGGLALAIEQAAKLIKNQRKSLRGFLDLFMERLPKLPLRLKGERDELIQALDTIWSISFDSLSKNARTFLAVLAFLAPEGIQEDLFLPRDQTALRGKLEFCMTGPTVQGPSALSSVAAPSSGLQEVITELLNAKLIDVDNRIFNVHRVIQEAMNFQNIADLQDCFDAAVRIVYEAFPQQQNTSVGPGHELWSSCQEYVQHVVHLFARFKEYQPENVHLVSHLNPSRELILLGANCGWYLLEIADYDACLDMVKTAQSVCNDPETLTVARLQNIAAAVHFDRNELEPCREGWENAKRIRMDNLEADDPLVASSLANLGNVETAEENYEEARKLYQQAAKIREETGDSAATMLALTYLQLGRVDTLERNFADSLKWLQRSESLFNRQTGSRLHYLADLYYAYGNREYLQSNYKEARRRFERCLKYAEEKRPLHPLACAAYYKLGSCEFELDDYEKARKMLMKALNIAEIQNPEGLDGTIARIWWKLAQVYTFMRAYSEQTQQIEKKAYEIRAKLKGVSVSDNKWTNDQEFEEMEHSYDILVPTFFR